MPSLLGPVERSILRQIEQTRRGAFQPKAQADLSPMQHNPDMIHGHAKSRRYLLVALSPEMTASDDLRIAIGEMQHRRAQSGDSLASKDQRR
jgi:hypothetical protein